MTRPLLQTLHDHAENEAMFALANDVLKVQKDFPPFDIHVVGGWLSKEDFRIKHVPSKFEYQVNFMAAGIDPFNLSVVMEVTRLEAECDPVVIGTYKSTLDTLRHILIDAVVDTHFRELTRKD